MGRNADKRRKSKARAQSIAALAAGAPAEPAQSPEDRAALAELRTQRTLTYATGEHDWRSPVVDAMGMEALDRLPSATDGCSRGGSRGTGAAWMRKWTTRNEKVRERILEAYLGFLQRVVLPHVREVCARHGSTLCDEGLVFQREPSFRCHAPSPQPTGRPHSDSDYGHSVYELNVWLPLTPCGGSNSLWCESAPGAGDFAPFAAAYGEAVLFWGNQCRHHTLANDSGTSRVSFDFRFLFRRLYSPDIANIYGGPTAFLLGGYFDALDNEGALDAGVARPRGHGVLYRQGD